MDWVEILRWLGMVGGAIVLGLHFAVYKNAPRITFHPRPWRIFIAGNTLLTFYAVARLLRETDGGTVYIVAIAMIVTLIGIILLDHSYHIRKAQEAANEQRRTARS